MGEGELILTVAEAADFARVSETTIRRWMAEGLKHMPTVATKGKRGPRMEIIRRSELLKFIAAREEGGAKAPGAEADPRKPKAVASTAGGDWWEKPKGKAGR